MQENSPRMLCKSRSSKDSISRNDHPRRASLRNRYFAAEETLADSSVDRCSGEHCRSCAAALIADCVAVCCCPLALVSLLALAFVKVPYLVGRRCWRRRKKQKRKCKKIESSSIEHDMVMSSTSSRDINLITGRLSQRKSDIIFEFGDEEELEERKSFCAAFEADKVLMEMYQIGHLGFGILEFNLFLRRTSISGTEMFCFSPLHTKELVKLAGLSAVASKSCFSLRGEKSFWYVLLTLGISVTTSTCLLQY